MKISRKTIALLSGGMSIIVIGATALVAANFIKKSSSSSDSSETKPMNRGDNYEHYKISQYVQNNNQLTNIVSIYVEQDKYHRKINEEKFINQISILVKDALGNVSKFKSSIDKYKFDLSYSINSNESEVLIDVVWYIPNTSYQYYYYDQFKISINNGN